MRSATVRLEIYAQWWIWTGSYADNGKSSASTVNDPMTWPSYDEAIAFPRLKPDFTVFGVPVRSRKQRGWYHVQKLRSSCPPSITTTSFIPPTAATGADIPPELFDRIIQEIAPNYLTDSSHDERRTLAACGQVCRYWAEKCNKVLYYRLNLRERDDFLALRAFNGDPAPHIFRYWADSDIHVSVTQLAAVPWLHLVTALLQNARQVGPAVRVTVEGPLPPGLKSMRTLHPGLPRAPRQFSYGITHLILTSIHFRLLHDLMSVLRELPYLYWVECESLTWGLLPSTIPRRLRSSALPLQIPAYTMVLWQCSPTWAQAVLFLYPCFIPHDTPWWMSDDLSRLITLVQTLKMTTQEFVCCASFVYIEGWDGAGTIVLDLTIQEPGPSGKLLHRDPGYHLETRICCLSIKAGHLHDANRLHFGSNQDGHVKLQMHTVALNVQDPRRAAALFDWELLDNALCSFPALHNIVFGFGSAQDMQLFVKDVTSTRLPLVSSRNLLRYAVDGIRTGEYAGWFRVSLESDLKQRSGTTTLVDAY